MIWVIKILEQRAVLKGDKIVFEENQVKSFRVAENPDAIADALLNAWCTSNPGRAATYVISAWRNPEE
jgi:hypothetical protein